jgi:hypothetical protein
MAEKELKKEEFPSNRKTTEKKEKEAIRTVTKAVVVEKNVPLLARLFGGHMQQVGTYILWDVLIPAAKSTVSDIINNGIEMLMYGEPGTSSKRRGRLKRDRDRTYVGYNSMYDRPSRKSRQQETRGGRGRPSRHQFDDIIIESKPEAEEVLTVLVEAVEMYDSCTVADLYEAVGLPTDFTDHKWGWYNLSSAYVKRDRWGYGLVLPKPEPLE